MWGGVSWDYTVGVHTLVLKRSIRECYLENWFLRLRLRGKLARWGVIKSTSSKSHTRLLGKAEPFPQEEIEEVYCEWVSMKEGEVEVTRSLRWSWRLVCLGLHKSSKALGLILKVWGTAERFEHRSLKSNSIHWQICAGTGYQSLCWKLRCKVHVKWSLSSRSSSP